MPGPVTLAHVSGIDVCLLPWRCVSGLEAVPVLRELSRFQLVGVCDSQCLGKTSMHRRMLKNDMANLYRCELTSDIYVCMYINKYFRASL